MRTKSKALNMRQDLFVRAYVANGGNGVRAAISAGYTDNYEAAQVHASKLLSKAMVSEAIAARREWLAQKYKITEERIINELAYIALFSFKDTMDDQGSCSADLDLMPAEAAAAIESVTVRKDDAGEFLQIATYSKLDAIEKLVDYLGFFPKDKDGGSRKQVLQETMERIRERLMTYKSRAVLDEEKVKDAEASAKIDTLDETKLKS